MNCNRCIKSMMSRLQAFVRAAIAKASTSDILDSLANQPPDAIAERDTYVMSDEETQQLNMLLAQLNPPTADHQGAVGELARFGDDRFLEDDPSEVRSFTRWLIEHTDEQNDLAFRVLSTMGNLRNVVVSLNIDDPQHRLLDQRICAAYINKTKRAIDYTQKRNGVFISENDAMYLLYGVGRTRALEMRWNTLSPAEREQIVQDALDTNALKIDQNTIESYLPPDIQEGAARGLSVYGDALIGIAVSQLTDPTADHQKAKALYQQAQSTMLPSRSLIKPTAKRLESAIALMSSPDAQIRRIGESVLTDSLSGMEWDVFESDWDTLPDKDFYAPAEFMRPIIHQSPEMAERMMTRSKVHGISLRGLNWKNAAERRIAVQTMLADGDRFNRLADPNSAGRSAEFPTPNTIKIGIDAANRNTYGATALLDRMEKEWASLSGDEKTAVLRDFAPVLRLDMSYPDLESMTSYEARALQGVREDFIKTRRAFATKAIQDFPGGEPFRAEFEKALMATEQFPI